MEALHKVGAGSSEVDERPGDTEEDTASEISLEFERQQAVQELEEIFGECGTGEIETKAAKKTFKAPS